MTAGQEKSIEVSVINGGPNGAAPPPMDNSGISGNSEAAAKPAGRFKLFKRPPKEEANKNALPYSALYRYATPLDKAMICVAAVGSAANGSVLPIFSVIFGQLLNNLSSEAEIVDKITLSAYYFLILGGSSWILSWFQVGFWTIIGERLTKRIREEYFRAVMHQEISWFDKERVSELAPRIASDSILIQDAVGEKVGNYIHFNFMFIAGVIVGFVNGWQLTLVMLAVAPLLAIAGAFMAKVLASMATKGQAAYAKAGSVAEEVLSTIRTVVAFGGEPQELRRYESNLGDAQKIGIQKGNATGIGMGTVMFLMFSTYSLSFWFGSRLIIDGVTNPTTGDPYNGGDIVTVFFAVLMGAMGIGQAAPNLPAFAAGQGAGFKVFQVIDSMPHIDAFSDKGERIDPDHLRGDTDLRGVRFAYPARPEAEIFASLSLSIKQGETVALVGPSGCGKSTVIQLIQRFYDPLDGVVTLDNKDLRTLNVRWLREQIGLVSQEPVLFATTIKQNILFGNQYATDEDMIEAARMANAHNFISELPKGYDTYVGDLGAQLSGGQKQRIAIARAILRNPRILLLDEATSALDSESEHIVQEALDRIMVGRTTIIVAHRLSTIRNADKIIVLKDGRVAETGTHDELMALEGVYSNLVRLQTGMH